MSAAERIGLFGAYAVGTGALLAPFSLVWSGIMVVIAVVVGALS